MIEKWHAIIPFKGGERKTRLAERLDAQERMRLSNRFFKHVVSILRQSPAISHITLLSDCRPGDWNGGFIADEGRGLNGELQAVAALLRTNPLLVILADLPLLSQEDICVLLAAGSHGCAIAPDWRKTGTNALALSDPSDFKFAFGLNSFALHMAEAKARADVVARLGLALDVDTPDDLKAAISHGFSL